ncbi:MAG: Ppx/GppA family phosphatase, partial [Rickettsiaceae bacterium]|nr:Ppx/GppA family phosphatase [Rickettsiaceae bacterium]
TAEFMLSSDIPFDHRQRLMLGIATSHAFSSKKDLYINKLAVKILTPIDYNNSQIIGNILRIAKEVDGPAFKCPSFNLQLKDSTYIEITTNEILPRPVFENVCNRLKDIGTARKIAKESLLI